MWSRALNTAYKLECFLSGDVKLTKKADSNKYSYSGYDIGFSSQSLFLKSNFDFGENFDVNNSSSAHSDNKGRFLVYGKWLTQELDDTTITAEAKYSIDFTASEITLH